jgi:hypothetical protein
MYAGLGANLLKGWCDLYLYGQEHGFEFLTFDQVSDWERVDAIILCDRPLPGNPLVDAAMHSSARKYLITSECPIIYQPSWDTEYHRQFHRVWTWDDSLVDGTHYLKGNTVADPTLAFDFEWLKQQFEHRKLVTVIAGAKASQHTNELYSHRIRTIQWFEATAPEHFDLYGMGWNKAQFPSYQGPVDDKLETLSRYRFCICYENAQGYPGYITEKIIDCLRSGTVPVYGGAPNVARWIPEDCFIAVSQFATYFDMFEYLKGMDAQTHAGYLDRIARFVTGPDFYPFSIACMVEGLTRTLHWDIRGKTPAQKLVQNATTMRMEVRDDPTWTPLIVWLAYDPDFAMQRKVRSIWQFYAEHFPQVRFCFVRQAHELSAGEILDNGYDILVGGNRDLTTALHDLVLRRLPIPFMLLKASLWTAFDPSKCEKNCSSLSQDVHWQGEPGCLMGRKAVELSKRSAHSIDAISAERNAAHEWPAEFAWEVHHTDDPWQLLNHMRLILQSLRLTAHE